MAFYICTDSMIEHRLKRAKCEECRDKF